MNAEWAIHPQIKADLSAEEWKELGELMGKVTDRSSDTGFQRISARADRAPQETHSLSGLDIVARQSLPDSS